jgi:hypothetical protein
VRLVGNMPLRCAIAASAVADREAISVVLACAEFVFVKWHCRAKSLVSLSLHGKRVEVIA